MADILRLGLPSALQSMLFSCISMVIARMIAVWGDGAVAVQKVGSQIESISWMSAEGFAAALNTFTAQNYGAGNARRIETGLSLSVRIMLGWGLFTTAVLLFFPGPIFRIFITDPSIQAMGIDYLRILALSWRSCVWNTPLPAPSTGWTDPAAFHRQRHAHSGTHSPRRRADVLARPQRRVVGDHHQLFRQRHLAVWLAVQKKREPGFLTRETSPALDA
ncbi:MAG: MATE family efflux transporter [Merdibacter sp.]